MGICRDGSSLVTGRELSTSEHEILRRTHEVQQVWDREGWVDGEEYNMELVKVGGRDPRKRRFQVHEGTPESKIAEVRECGICHIRHMNQVPFDIGAAERGDWGVEINL